MTPPEAEPSRRRSRLRASVRGLMALTLVVAAVAGWTRHAITTQRQAIAAARAAGGTVKFDYREQRIGTGSHGSRIYRVEPAAPRWLRRWLGDELFQSVRTVHFGTVRGPAAMACLVRFDRLEELTVVDDRSDGTGYAKLRGLRHLRELSVTGPGVNDVALADISELTSLRTLKVDNPSATDVGFVRLAGLHGLEELMIRVGPHQVSDAGLARAIEGMPALTSLDLDRGSPKIGKEPEAVSATLAALGRRHPPLEKLYLKRARVADTDLVAIAGLTRLRELDLGLTRVSDAGVAHLAAMSLLEDLDLAETAISDAGMAIVGRLTNLEKLDLSKTGIGDVGLTRLAGLSKLWRLNICQTRVTAAGVPTIVRMTDMIILGLCDNPAITDESLLLLAQLPKLQNLDVTGSGVTQAGGAAFRKLNPGVLLWDEY